MSFPSRLRHPLMAIAFALIVQLPVAGWAQTAPGPATTAPPVAAQASLGHAALKGLTLKVINGAVALGIFATGTGTIVGGSVLAAAVALSSFTVFTINDYVWDTYFPNTNLAANNQSFSTFGSLSRNTAKFLTFKPAVVAVDWSVIYLYTGSMASMFTMGPAYSILSPLTFYANNTLWDWYDWRNAAASQASPVGASASR
jgi:uncharacterized membrane protein